MIILGDCLEKLKKLDTNSIDLVITSPPYADRRKNVYGGLPPNKYIPWFLEIGKEIKRVIKPTGSFFLNIKAHTVKGERDLYVFRLVIALRDEIGFKFIDNYAWVKNSFPGNYRGKFKNGWEPVYHFSKEKSTKIKFNPLACGTPQKEESTKRAFRKHIGYSRNGSNMMVNLDNIKNIKLARPTNVLRINNVMNQWDKRIFHPAVYPVELCDFFIKSFTNEGDIVLDPFAGSGTTGISAKKNNRQYILIEKEKKFCDLMKEILNE